MQIFFAISAIFVPNKHPQCHLFHKTNHPSINSMGGNYGNQKKQPMPLNRLGMLLSKQGFKGVRSGPQNMRKLIVNQRSNNKVNLNKKQ